MSIADIERRNAGRNRSVAPSAQTFETGKPTALSPLAEMIASTPVPATYSPIIITGLVRFGEAIGLFLVGVVALSLFSGSSEWFWLEALLLPAVTITAIVLFEAAHLYSVPMFRNLSAQAIRLACAWTVAVAAPWVLFAALGYTTPGPSWMLAWWSCGVIALIAGRGIVCAVVRHWTAAGRLKRRTAIVGGGPAAENLINAIQADTMSDVDICGVFDDRTDERSPDTVAGLPKLGTVNNLVEFARRTRLDLVIFTLPITAEGRILEMLKKLSILPIDIRLSAHTNKLQFRPRSYSYLGSIPVIDIFDRPIADWDVVIKAMFDRVVGAIALICLSPVMLATAVAIKLDSRGPIFFRQKRYGFNNELIEVFKFRSMYTEHTDPTASRLVQVNDPRVTRIGHFIRRTSIDELPQLLNVVWKGNLSLVGPRPHAIHAKAEDRLYDEAVDGYFARHRVKPGITGWAQICGWRGETDTQEKIQQRVEHDLYYIENWSVLFDIKILLKTPLSLLNSKSAY
ncbi:undecaprenyl-phosphate glucose phosphotransferase [Flaviflagellibacter deserti]|uniref:Undecaprenyl-phosphate glucose phosphotransferase n=1 Tax=Flaviflagellibacter deserti TaxID=2267266 RepID=A0ABV9Z2F4_9HYPH